MKNFITFIFVTSFIFCTAQSKKELETRIGVIEKSHVELMTEVGNLKQEIAVLNSEISSLKRENDLLKQVIDNQQSKPHDSEESIQNAVEVSSTPGQCKAITSKGTHCSRKADPGSEYCWQHKKTYEPNSTPSKVTSTPSKSSGTIGSGRTIYTGPRGGKYYINSKGNKTYIKK